MSPRQRDAVLGWCDWIDAASGGPSPPECLGVDFDISGPRDAEFDVRYLPSQAPGSDFFVAVVRRYTDESRRDLDMDRVLARPDRAR